MRKYFIANDKLAKLIDYIMLNMNKPLLVKHSNLFNVFNDDESRAIISKALLDEYYVMGDSNKTDFLSNAKTIIYQFKKTKFEKKENELKEQMKKEDSNSPQYLKLMKNLQKLNQNKVELIKEFKNK